MSKGLRDSINFYLARVATALDDAKALLSECEQRLKKMNAPAGGNQRTLETFKNRIKGVAFFFNQGCKMTKLTETLMMFRPNCEKILLLVEQRDDANSLKRVGLGSDIEDPQGRAFWSTHFPEVWPTTRSVASVIG